MTHYTLIICHSTIKSVGKCLWRSSLSSKVARSRTVISLKKNSFTGILWSFGPDCRIATYCTDKLSSKRLFFRKCFGGKFFYCSSTYWLNSKKSYVFDKTINLIKIWIKLVSTAQLSRTQFIFKQLQLEKIVEARLQVST